MKTLQELKIRYEFTKEDIEFFKKDDKFHWDDVVALFDGEPNVVACNQKNLIIYRTINGSDKGYIWFQTKDVPAQRVKTKNDSDLDVSYIKGRSTAAYNGEWTTNGKVGSKEICIQALKWIIERGVTK